MSGDEGLFRHETALSWFMRLGHPSLVFRTGHEQFDAFCAVMPGDLVEIVGRDATGKLQLAMTLVAELLLSKSKAHHRVVVLDFNGSFRIDRLKQILVSREPRLIGEHEAIVGHLDNIYYSRVFCSEELEECLVELKGFIKSFVAFQNDLSITRRVLLIADLHSISTGRQEPAQLRLNTLRTLAALLACGVDPERTLLVQQSRLPEHTELMWILGSAATVASLSSLSQFKDKSAWYPEGVAPVGLLTYPLLQAADVLTYRATHVPVGDDQTQHMELVRHLATKFNLRYRCDFFPVPEKISGACARLRSLRNPSVKMSKSDTDTKSRIELVDTPELTTAKIRKAVTDFESRVTFDPEQRPGVSNLVTLFSLFSGLTVEQVLKQADGIDTLAFKGKLAELINSQLASIRERFSQFVGDERELERLLQYGEERSRPIAVDTLKEVKRIVGMR